MSFFSGFFCSIMMSSMESSLSFSSRESIFIRCACESEGVACSLSMLSSIRSRWGQRLGQKKAVGENNNLCKQKDPKPYGFGSFWHAVRDSNPRPSGP